jgi:hypothetical protein
LTRCSRPLDPIDAEALAAGGEPVFAADAARHSAQCASCEDRVRAARALLQALDGLEGPGIGLAGLADRVARLRAFSRKERRTYALWNAPVLLTGGLAALGTALLALPVLTASEQLSLGAAAAAPLVGLGRSAIRWGADLLALAPRGLDALSQGMQQDAALGLAALALLAPVGFALNRVLARVPGRK